MFSNILKFESEQVWVYGDSYQSKLIAVVHPKPSALKDWAKGAGKDGAPRARRCAPRVLVLRAGGAPQPPSYPTPTPTLPLPPRRLRRAVRRPRRRQVGRV